VAVNLLVASSFNSFVIARGVHCETEGYFQKQKYPESH
jgi:hypothetical protein